MGRGQGRLLLLGLAVCAGLLTAMAAGIVAETAAAKSVVVGMAQCVHCARKSMDAEATFKGLGVRIKCKNGNGEYESKAMGKLDSSGAFAVPLPADIDLRAAECFAQLHSASSSEPCPGQEPSKIVPLSEPDGTFVAMAGKTTELQSHSHHPGSECASANICFPCHNSRKNLFFGRKPFFMRRRMKPWPPEYELPAPEYGAPDCPPDSPEYGTPTPVYGTPAPRCLCSPTPAPGCQCPMPTPVYGMPAPVVYAPPAPVYAPPAAPVYGMPMPTPVYGTPIPTPVYAPPAPVYGTPTPVYAPPAAPVYGTPAPVYAPPTPTPVYGTPSPRCLCSPTPAPGCQCPAPVYGTPAPVLYPPPAPEYGTPTPTVCPPAAPVYGQPAPPECALPAPAYGAPPTPECPPAATPELVTPPAH